MTDEEQNKLGLTDRQRILYEYYESHPEELETLMVALQPAIDATAVIYEKITEALKPIIDALVPICVAMADEDLIDDEEDDEEDFEDD